MTEETAQEPDELDALRARADALERQIGEMLAQTQDRLIQAELKTEAVRAGMIDLDGLRLIDRTTLSISPDGSIMGAPELMRGLKRSKPWLFAGSNSSTPATPPSPVPPRARHATEMTFEEWQAARAEVLRRR